MSFTFGTDPEFMLSEKNTLKSAIGILPRKDDAISQNGNRYYFDNVLAEIAVKPARTQIESLANVRSSLHGLAKNICLDRASLKKTARKFLIRASSDYPQSELNCIDAKIAGCNPEWNVYTLQCVFPPDEEVDLLDGYYQFKTRFRSAGGHIHVGSELFSDGQEALNVIRMMDLFLGIPSIFLDNDETSYARRTIYGHAGSHRITDYGVEYRALGNFWLSSPDLVLLMYNLTEFVLDFVETKQHEKFWSVDYDLLDEEEDSSKAYNCFGYDVELLREAINNCDKKMADTFMTFIGNYLPSYLLRDIDKLSGKKLSDPYVSWDISKNV